MGKTLEFTLQSTAEHRKRNGASNHLRGHVPWRRECLLAPDQSISRLAPDASRM